MKPENVRMKKFLKENGIDAVPQYRDLGSLKGTWRLSGHKQKWTHDLKKKLIELGFTDFDGRSLNIWSGNGGMFEVFVRGHNEFLKEEGVDEKTAKG